MQIYGSGAGGYTNTAIVDTGGALRVFDPSGAGAGGYAGSDVYIKAGSVQTYTPLGSTFITGSVYSTGSLNIIYPFTTGSSFFSATGSIDYINIANPLKYWSIQVVGSNGTPTSWDVRLEGQIFTSGGTQIIAHTNTDGDGITKFIGGNTAPVLAYRTRVAGLVLGVGPVGIWIHTLGMT